MRERLLEEPERRQDVDLVDPSERRERIVGERRLRARPEDAGVVDEQVDARAGGGDERQPVLGVGDVAGNRDDTGEAGDGVLECLGASGVDDEPPATLREGVSEGAAEAARGPGDDADRPACAARPVLLLRPSRVSFW